MSSCETNIHFREHGYVLLQQQLSHVHGAQLARWVTELATWPEAPGKWMKWYEQCEGRRQLCRVEDFVPYHRGLEQLLRGPALASVLERLLGEPAELFKEKINFKLPGGAGFAPHQDAPAFAAFGQSYHVTVMIAVDAANRANGCLEIVDGFHGRGLLPQTAEATLDPAWSAQQTWKAIEMAPGDVLVFDSYVPHRSGANTTDQPRRALYVTYNRQCDGSLRAEYFRRKREAFPPECERRPGVDYSRAASTYNLGNPIR